MKYTYTIIGLLFDVFDFLGVGLIPILGDIVDIIATAFWFTKLGPTGLIAGIELIPLVDILPTNILLGYMVDQKGAKQHD